MVKRSIQLLAILSLVVGALLLATGCGAPSGGGSGSAPSTAPKSEASKSEAPKSEAQKPSGTPIKIGQVVDLSALGADVGEYEKKGAQLFVDELNAKGGLLGRPVELITRDGKGAVADAVNQARDLLYSENVDFLMTGTNSSYAVAISDLAKQAKKILMAETANDEFTMDKGHRYAFRVPNVIAMTQASSAATYAKQKLADKKRYYLIGHDYAFGRMVIADFKHRIKEAVPGVEFVGESYVKLTETDYNPYITAIMQAKPDVVYFAWQVGVPFFKQASPYQLSQKVQLLSGYWGGVQDVMTMPKEDLPVGAVVGGIPWYGLDSSENKAFVDAFKKKWDLYPKPTSYYDYISLQVLTAGIKKAGTTDTEKVVAALEGLEAETVLGKLKIRDFDHQAVTPYWLGTVKWDDNLKMGVIGDITKLDTASFLPTADDVAKSRKSR